MFLHRIQHRLIFLFVLLVVAILFISGWTLQWMIRQSLEVELGRKLVAVSNATSAQFEEDQVVYLMQSIGPRTQQRLRQILMRLKETTGVKRIYIFDPEGKSLLDTEEDVEQGTPYFHLRFYQKELEEIQSGRSTHSILFQGIDGLPTMTGYAPLLWNKKVVGGIAVDGSVTFLDAVARLRRRLYLIGILGTAVAIGLGILMAGTITRPIKKLSKISRKIGRGDYSEPIPPMAKSEIGLLAETMEEMRKGVVERERELKAMLAGVAHEIRNPLGGIELFTGLLSDEVAKNEDARAHVDRIANEVSHLKEIVNSFLAYARPQEPNKEKCRVSEVIAEVNLLLKNQMGKNKIVLSAPDDMNRAMVWVDPTHLKRIVLNLFQNAIQAMPNGGEFRIHWTQTNDSASLFFKDTGDGIPQDTQEKIFIPFFTTREKGTGLGLPIANGLAEVNGGSLRLVRSDHNGTEFELTLERYKKP